MEKNYFICAILMVVISLNAFAQDDGRDMQWFDISTLNYVVTGNTDKNHVLQQHLLIDGAVVEAKSDIMDRMQTCMKEISQRFVNEKDADVGQLTDEITANLKQMMQEHPELAPQLEQQLKELAQQRSDFSNTYVKEVGDYTYPPEQVLKEITAIAVNKRAYSAWSDMGNGLFAVLTGECYGPLEKDNFNRPKVKESDEYTWGAINYDGKFILEAKYSQPVSYPEHNFIILRYKQGGEQKCGACGFNGEVRVPFVYNDAHWYGAGFHLYIFEKNNKYGFISLDGKELQPCVYEKPEPFGSGWSVTKDGTNYGLVDHVNGKLVIPLKYKSVWDNKMDEIFMQRFDKKIDVYNENGFNLIRTIDDPED